MNRFEPYSDEEYRKIRILGPDDNIVINSNIGITGRDAAEIAGILSPRVESLDAVEMNQLDICQKIADMEGVLIDDLRLVNDSSINETEKLEEDEGK